MVYPGPGWYYTEPHSVSAAQDSGAQRRAGMLAGSACARLNCGTAKSLAGDLSQDVRLFSLIRLIRGWWVCILLHVASTRRPGVARASERVSERALRGILQRRPAFG